MKRLAEVLAGPGALAVDGEVDAMIAQYADEQVDVGEVRDVFQRQPVSRSKGWRSSAAGRRSWRRRSESSR